MLFQSNKGGRDYGLFHVSMNAQLELISSKFEDNMCLSRGVVVYGEKEASKTIVRNCDFLKNNGNLGGIFFTD